MYNNILWWSDSMITVCFDRICPFKIATGPQLCSQKPVHTVGWCCVPQKGAWDRQIHTSTHDLKDWKGEWRRKITLKNPSCESHLQLHKRGLRAHCSNFREAPTHRWGNPVETGLLRKPERFQETTKKYAHQVNRSFVWYPFKTRGFWKTCHGWTGFVLQNPDKVKGFTVCNPSKRTPSFRCRVLKLYHINRFWGCTIYHNTRDVTLGCLLSVGCHQ